MPSKLERLLEWFQQYDAQLKAWAAQSDTHSQLLLSDPVKAIREAGLTIPDDLILELRRVAKAIFHKFKTGIN